MRFEYLDRKAASASAADRSFDDAALIGFEPDAGFADAYMVAMSFAKGARRRGVKMKEGVTVNRLVKEGSRIVGVATTAGGFACDTLVSTQNIWTTELGEWVHASMQVLPERHAVLALECEEAPYTFQMPVFKDLSSPGMLYCRSYGGTQMLVSEGLVGESSRNRIPSRGTSRSTMWPRSARKSPNAFRHTKPQDLPLRGQASTTSPRTGTRSSADCRVSRGWWWATAFRGTASSCRRPWAECSHKKLSV